MVEIHFGYDELDLVFYYLDVQMKSFDEDGIPRPHHEVSLAEDNIVVTLSIPDGNPDWPLGPQRDGEE